MTTRTMTTRIFTLGLAAIGLAAVPARAQTLSNFSGTDNVTVSGSGTQGTYHGKPISNTTTSYTATATPGAAVTLDNGATFTLASGGTLSGGATSQSEGLDIGLAATTAGGTGTAFVTGGTITGFDAISIGGGTVTITSGSITGGVGAGAGLVAQMSGVTSGTGGTINLYGTNFLVNGLAAPSQLTGTGTNTITGTVSGTLANGDLLSTTYQLVGAGTTINFFAPAAAPEPSSFAALGIGLLGLGALAFKAKRRTA